MASFKFLKNIDLFCTPVQTFTTSRDKKSNHKSFSEDHGSIIGGFLSVVCILCTMSYIISLFLNMISGSSDNFNTQVTSNNFDSINNLEYIANSSFLPSFELRGLDS